MREARGCARGCGSGGGSQPPRKGTQGPRGRGGRATRDGAARVLAISSAPDAHADAFPPQPAPAAALLAQLPFEREMRARVAHG